jgi:hypothetical protein
MAECEREYARCVLTWLLDESLEFAICEAGGGYEHTEWRPVRLTADQILDAYARKAGGVTPTPPPYRLLLR